MNRSLAEEVAMQNPLDDHGIIAAVAQNAGIDWEYLSFEQKSAIAEKFSENLRSYILEVAARLDDLELAKHLHMIIASNFNLQLLSKYPDVQNFLELISNVYINQLVNSL